MKPLLTFQKEVFRVGGFGVPSSVPDLVGNSIIQEEPRDEIHEYEICIGYGRHHTSYPYRQNLTYDRHLTERKIETAIIENDHVRAQFLPSLGGRLWSLIDKHTGENLLYTNDVIRCSNLAVCNAWFSGGVEWNISMIGHSPFTTKPLFTAALTDESGNPVLRMYEYERLRSVVWQMDFWLGETDRALSCRMRIFNVSDQKVPMYWWSNMAVPEYEHGRVVVPADSAYSSDNKRVYRVPIPVVDGVDVTRYENIPHQVDYFFDLAHPKYPYIANLNQAGYGLLQRSTPRQQSRKLFCWGTSEASCNWQDFLTDQAGHYVEIQAGLPKTQYACIEMQPHEVWEWLEQYGPVTLQGCAQDFVSCRDALSELVAGEKDLADILKQTEKMADTRAKICRAGSVYGSLHQACAVQVGSSSLPAHLDFESGKESMWISFLKTGRLPDIEPDAVPEDFVSEPVLIDRLRESLSSGNGDNWYAWYQSALIYLRDGDSGQAQGALHKADGLSHNAWICHALAVCYLLQKEYDKAICMMEQGLRMRMTDLSYQKEGGRLLQRLGAWSTWSAVYADLSDELKRDGRLYFYELMAMSRTGREAEAYEALSKESTMFLDDLRECEDSVEQLWQDLHQTLCGIPGETPHWFRYNSM